MSYLTFYEAQALKCPLNGKFCVVEKCPAWRKSADHKKVAKGYCGLGGKPEK